MDYKVLKTIGKLTSRNGEEMSWDAVVFDFDGVLTDSEPLHHATLQRVVAEKGMSISWEEYCSGYMGFDDRQAFETCFANHGVSLDEATLQACIREKAGLFSVLAEESDIQPFPGVVEFIGALRDAGLPMALCSGALLSDVMPFLRKFGIREAFSAISTAEDVSHSKPSPEPYLHALASLSGVLDHPLLPKRCVAFEDTQEGMVSAEKAGLQVIAVLHQNQNVNFSPRLTTLNGFEGFSVEALQALSCTMESDA
ncbi:MAG: HAD family phosphatase [Kiritimatiellae bacterium]|nr:HAD family phosphatase [Kiritimatiellia bacterium]